MKAMIIMIKSIYTGGIVSVCVILFALLTLLFSACKKEPTDSNSKDCFTIPRHNKFGHGYNGLSDSVAFIRPCYNPKNDDEFIFVKNTYGNSYSSKILKYNFQSNTLSQIYSGPVWSTPQWGKNDWIIFASEFQIFKVKSNGDSLTQITRNGFYHSPRWYFETNEFVAYCQSLQAAIIFDIKGNIIDTLPTTVHETSTLSNFPYLVTHSGGAKWVLFLNLLTFNVDFVYNYSSQIDEMVYGGNPGGSVFWINNSELIYTNLNGLNRLSIPSLRNVNFKEGCNSKRYFIGSINPSKTKMIWSRIDIKYIHEDSLESKERLYIMNIDGSNEQEVNLNKSF